MKLTDHMLTALRFAEENGGRASRLEHPSVIPPQTLAGLEGRGLVLLHFEHSFSYIDEYSITSAGKAALLDAKP